MTELTVLVVDDEPVARATIRGLVGADAALRLVGECGDGRSALEAIVRERPDILFLDVEMPEMTGLEVLAALPEGERPIVVFTTAYDHFATKAFDENATDYLLKPFSDERFARALERAKEGVRLARLVRSGAVPSEPDAATSGERRDRLTIHREGRLIVVHTSEIEWIQSADQYVRLHTDTGEHLMRASMSELERLLEPERFTRVHRSAIVAIDRVRRLETRGGGTGRVLLEGGEWVPVSRSQVPRVRRLLG